MRRSPKPSTRSRGKVFPICPTGLSPRLHCAEICRCSRETQESNPRELKRSGEERCSPVSLCELGMACPPNKEKGRDLHKPRSIPYPATYIPYEEKTI